MASIAVNISVLNSSEAERYFTKSEHRMACFRGTLELLGIPLPNWAERKPSGRKPSIAVARAYETDNPTPRFGGGTLPPRKPNATPERIAAIKAKREAAAAPDSVLFNHLFPDAANPLG